MKFAVVFMIKGRKKIKFVWGMVKKERVDRNREKQRKRRGAKNIIS